MWCHPLGLAQGLICIQGSANISVQVYLQPPAISIINLCVILLLAWLPPFQQIMAEKTHLSMTNATNVLYSSL